MKTARLNVLLEPGDKTLIERGAQAAGVSVGEFVRRAATAYVDRAQEPSEVEMEALVATVAAMADRMERSLDARLAEVAALRAEMAAARAARPASGDWPF